MQYTDIAVIGAGLAGVSCARQLAAAGRQVTVFDKSKGMGGRMATRRGDGFSVDHGAQYFTAQQPDFHAEIHAWQAAGLCAPWQARLVQHRPTGPVDGYPEHRYVATPGMSSLCRALAAALPVQLNHRLTALQRQADGWQLSFADQPSWRARQVLLAAPAPQAAALLEAAPALRALAAGVEMEACWAVMLHAQAPLEIGFDAAWVEHGPLRWLARNSSKPGRSGAESWLLHATPAWSAAHIDAPADEVAGLLHAAFAELVDSAVDARNRSAHRWLYAQAAQPLDIGSAYQAELGLGLCGDWCLGTRVEDAWRSGRHLAEQALAAA